jgi:hypothetical protein
MLDVMSQIDNTKKIYLIVHGQRQLMDAVQDKLAAKFSKENMLPASLEKAGTNPGGGGARGMGAWGNVAMKEIMRLPIK